MLSQLNSRLNQCKSQLNFSHLLVLLVVSFVFILGIVWRVEIALLINDVYVHADQSRDLLVAYHHVVYDEPFTSGPDTSYTSISNSTFYFHFVSAVAIWFGFSEMALAIANVCLQILSIGLLFWAVRLIWGTTTALFAVALMSGLGLFIDQSRFMWQPHIMQFTIVCTTLCLALGHIYKRLAYIHIATVLFIVSIALHLSAILLAPLVSGLIGVILYRHSFPIQHYIFVVFTGCITAGFLFWETIIYKLSTSSLTESVFINHFMSVDPLRTLVERTQHLLQLIFANLHTSVLLTGLYILLFCLLLFYLTQKNSKHFSLYVAIGLNFVVIIGLVGVLANPYGETIAFPIRYYTPVFILLVLLLSVPLAVFAKKGTVPMVGSVAILLTIIFSSNHYLSGVRVVTDTYGFAYPLTYFMLHEREVVKADTQVIRELIAEYNLNGNLVILTVEGYRSPFVNERSSDVLWFPIEQSTASQMLVPSGDSLRKYRPKYNSEYAVIRCRGIAYADCIDVVVDTSSPSYIYNFETILAATSSSQNTLIFANLK